MGNIDEVALFETPKSICLVFNAQYPDASIAYLLESDCKLERISDVSVSMVGIASILLEFRPFQSMSLHRVCDNFVVEGVPANGF